MGQVTIAGTIYDIYGTHVGDPVGGALSAAKYFAAALSAASFTGADSDQQKKALVTATRMLDRAAWQGTKTSPAQPLDFPRTGLVDQNGLPVDPSAVPLGIVYGCYELANALLSAPSTETTPSAGSNVRRQKNLDQVGTLKQEVETEYFRPTDLTAGRFPQVVQELVGPFLAGSVVVAPFASGTDVESAFDDEDEGFGFTLPGL